MTDIGRLKELEEHFDDCVEEAVREAKDDADQFDKVLWKVLRLYLTSRPSFNWADYDDGITADQVYDFLIEDASEMDDSNAHLLSEIETLRTKSGSLFDAIQHGDDEHRAWLKAAITAHFAGEPVPPPSGSGRKDAEIETLRAENERLKAALKPFAELADKPSPPLSDYHRVSISLGDCRRAASILASHKENTDG